MVWAISGSKPVPHMPLEFQRFFRLFCELDGDDRQQRPEVTHACIEALFDRLVNPPMLEDEMLTLGDVDAAERAAIALIQAEADKVRELIRNNGSSQ